MNEGVYKLAFWTYLVGLAHSWNGVGGVSDHVPWNWIMARGAGAGHQYPMMIMQWDFYVEAPLDAEYLTAWNSGLISYCELSEIPQKSLAGYKEILNVIPIRLLARFSFVIFELKHAQSNDQSLLARWYHATGSRFDL